jgi:hypothetical protein
MPVGHEEQQAGLISAGKQAFSWPVGLLGTEKETVLLPVVWGAGISEIHNGQCWHPLSWRLTLPGGSVSAWTGAHPAASGLSSWGDIGTV